MRRDKGGKRLSCPPSRSAVLGEPGLLKPFLPSRCGEHPLRMAPKTLSGPGAGNRCPQASFSFGGHFPGRGCRRRIPPSIDSPGRHRLFPTEGRFDSLRCGHQPGPFPGFAKRNGGRTAREKAFSRRLAPRSWPYFFMPFRYVRKNVFRFAYFFHPFLKKSAVYMRPAKA